MQPQLQLLRLPNDNLAEAHRVLRNDRPYRERAVSCHGDVFRRWGKTGPTVLQLLTASVPNS